MRYYKSNATKANATKANATKANEWRRYHKVSFRNLSCGRIAVSECVEELNLRTLYAKKYHNGKFDAKHRRVMQFIGRHVRGDAALGLSLDAIIASRNIHVKNVMKYRRYKK